MKPVSLETVRDRINLLETAQSEIGLLSLAGEFELACLRQLLAAKTQLAELAKQKPVGVARMELAIGKEGLRYYQCFVDMRPDLVLADLNTGMELFTRPAPAADLDAKRLAFIASLADDTAPHQFDSLATNVHREIKK